MKKFKIFTLIIAIVLAFSSMNLVAFAESEEPCTHADCEITYEFSKELTDEEKARIIASINGEDDGAQTYGLTCTLFGHELDTGTTDIIEHKVRTTAPRCLRRTYEYELCTRCDYNTSTLIGTTYIYCCA